MLLALARTHTRHDCVAILTSPVPASTHVITSNRTESARLTHLGWEMAGHHVVTDIQVLQDTCGCQIHRKLPGKPVAASPVCSKLVPICAGRQPACNTVVTGQTEG
jgi:hypothetical protein